MKDPDDIAARTRERIKQDFIARRGYWRPWVDTTLDANPGFVEQYARYAGYPARTGPLSPRMVELVYVALDSSSSHLFESGLTTHMQKALEAGATQADIFDVLHLVAVQGVASVRQATDILAECTGQDATDPAYAEVLDDFIEQGRPAGGLAPAERSLVQVALHACFTAFNPQAVRQMVTTGLSQGLQTEELRQAIQLGAHLAVHGSALGAKVFRQLTSPGDEK